jgi:hypothetical protein
MNASCTVTMDADKEVFVTIFQGSLQASER